MGEMGRAFDGSYAQYALLPDEHIHPASSSLPWEQLAAVPKTYDTAFGSLEKLRLEDGDDVLVRGATSGVDIVFLELREGPLSLMPPKRRTRKPTSRSKHVDKQKEREYSPQNGNDNGGNPIDSALSIAGLRLSDRGQDSNDETRKTNRRENKDENSPYDVQGAIWLNNGGAVAINVLRHTGIHDEQGQRAGHDSENRQR